MVSKHSSIPPIFRLLVPRHEARVLLGGISTEGIRDLERRGLLTPIKLSPWAKQAHCFYAMRELEALPAALLALAEPAAGMADADLGNQQRKSDLVATALSVGPSPPAGQPQTGERKRPAGN